MTKGEENAGAPGESAHEAKTADSLPLPNAYTALGKVKSSLKSLNWSFNRLADISESLFYLSQMSMARPVEGFDDQHNEGLVKLMVHEIHRLHSEIQDLSDIVVDLANVSGEGHWWNAKNLYTKRLIDLGHLEGIEWEGSVGGKGETPQ